MEYSFIKDLKNDNDSLMIRVRVCRMWESINTKKNGELISLNMIFIDEKVYKETFYAIVYSIFF